MSFKDPQTSLPQWGLGVSLKLPMGALKSFLTKTQQLMATFDVTLIHVCRGGRSLQLSGMLIQVIGPNNGGSVQSNGVTRG